MKTYDVVWITPSPENEARALGLVNRLDPMEISLRRLESMQGLRVCLSGAVIPDSSGASVGEGHCIFTNTLGSAAFRPGAVTPQASGPRLAFAHWLSDIQEIAPGITVANFNPAAYESEEWQKERSDHIVQERTRLEALAANSVTGLEYLITKTARIVKGVMLAPMSIICTALSWSWSVIVAVVVTLPAELALLPLRIARNKRDRHRPYGDPFANARGAVAAFHANRPVKAMQHGLLSKR